MVAVAEVLAGDPRAVARALSVAERGGPGAEELLTALRGRLGQARTVGVTGAPGVGKSTLVQDLGLSLLRHGSRVAVLAVDPSSPFTGGALLGDRVRMPEFLAAGGFVRSMATRGALGGLAVAASDALDVLDLFRRKGYRCGYLTTNGTLIDEERANALAALARTGFLKHISVSIDGPKDLHDAARGVTGTFERTAAGLSRLRQAALRAGAPLRVTINTTVSREVLGALDRMVDVAGELGVDAIGLNHLMFSTPGEVEETARLAGAPDRSAIATCVT